MTDNLDDDGLLDDSWTAGGYSSCRRCIHKISYRECVAFPDGIPKPIWNGENPHTEPFEGDQGIRFERRP